MPRSRRVTGVVVVGALAWFGAAGCAGAIGTPTGESPGPTASRVLPTPNLAEPTPADPAQILRATVVPLLLTSLPSPDGRLRAEIVTYVCTPVEGEQAYALDQLAIRGSNPDSPWVADEQLQACGGLGAYGLGGLYWSSDSQRFYYTPAREGVPDGCGMWLPPIAFADVQRKIVRELGAGVLSPDGSILAVHQEAEILLWDVDLGEIGRSPLAVPDIGLGAVAWSPDGRALAYLQVRGDCMPEGKAHVVRLMLDGLKADLLLESESPVFGGLIWPDPGYLELVDADGGRWRLDLASRILTAEPEA